jgi:toxin YhaV
VFAALLKSIFEAVPSDPNRQEYRQGNTMGGAFRHWRRAKIGRRFRLFFRFDSKTRIIIFVRVDNEHTLRASGSKIDPYIVFHRMLERGHPPDDWAGLLSASRTDWK